MKPPLQRIEEFLDREHEDTKQNLSRMFRLEKALAFCVGLVANEDGKRKKLKKIADILDGGEG